MTVLEMERAGERASHSRNGEFSHRRRSPPRFAFSLPPIFASSLLASDFALRRRMCRAGLNGISQVAILGTFSP